MTGRGRIRVAFSVPQFFSTGSGSYAARVGKPILFTGAVVSGSLLSGSLLRGETQLVCLHACLRDQHGLAVYRIYRRLSAEVYAHAYAPFEGKRIYTVSRVCATVELCMEPVCNDQIVALPGNDSAVRVLCWHKMIACEE